MIETDGLSYAPLENKLSSADNPSSHVSINDIKQIISRDYPTHSYSSPEITAIKINWGWWNQWTNPPVNDGWYTLTGSWTVHNGGTYDYNHYRKMIHGFSIAAY